MLNVSIVTYCPDWQGEVLPLVEELQKVQALHRVYVVDNSPEPFAIRVSDRVQYIHTGKNLGYGKAHNIAIRESIYDQVPLHLVMNSDILVKAEDIDTLCAFVLSQPAVGQLMPRVVNPQGELQHLCKLLPTPLDVFGRRFLPTVWMRKRNARYELHDADYSRPMNVPYLSGCFMLLRTEAVQKARLFDERYFMYPEDIDLTRTIHRDYLTLYYPAITIVHNHKKASYQSWRMLWVHIVNMCRYFNKWGWLFDAERRQFNTETERSYAVTSRQPR